MERAREKAREKAREEEMEEGKKVKMKRAMSQSWAKLLRSLTVNSLSYFVKTNY